MAKIKILGDMFQIKSILTQEEIERAQRYAPDALKLKDEEGNETFAIGVSESPSLSKYGINFTYTDDEGKVYMTIGANGNCTKEGVATAFAPVIRDLNKVEKAVAEVMEEVDALEKAVLESIEIVG